jgi:hypothetical protein
MQSNRAGTLAYVVAVGMLAIGAAAWAEDQTRAAPDHRGMMQEQHGGMMGGGMMGMMGGDPAQMNRMMENCNRMMETWLQEHPPAPGHVAPDKKG